MVRCELRTKATLKEILIDSLLGEPVCVRCKWKNKLVDYSGFFGGHNDKEVYVTVEKLDRPVTEMGFFDKFFQRIDAISKDKIVEVVHYTSATIYGIEKPF